MEGNKQTDPVFDESSKSTEETRKRDRPSSSNTTDIEFETVTSELTVLRADMRHLTSQIENVLSVVGQVSSDMATLLLKMNDHDKKFDQVNKKLDKQHSELTATKNQVKEVEKKFEATEKRLRTLEGQVIDQEARSRRNNLLFFGIPEKEGEKCTDDIKKLIKNELKLDPSGINIQRAHRFGVPKTRNAIGQSAQRPRPVIVNFSLYNDKEAVRAARHKLRRPLGISEDFPLPVRKARDSLVPELIELKNRGKKATILYPARLLCDGKILHDLNPVDFKTQ